MLIAAQPTRGLDVGAIEYVHRRLVAERDEGRAVLLVSLELDEVMSLSDRILVMFEGEIVGEYGPDVSEEELGIAMTGGRRKEPDSGVSDEEPASTRRSEKLQGGARRDARPTGGGYAPSVAARLALFQRAGGLVMPLVTTVFAFAMAMIVVAVTGHNPFTAFKGIFDGTGLNWLLPVGEGASTRPMRRSTSSRR